MLNYILWHGTGAQTDIRTGTLLSSTSDKLAEIASEAEIATDPFPITPS
jgi:hypothetical protein